MELSLFKPQMSHISHDYVLYSSFFCSFKFSELMCSPNIKKYLSILRFKAMEKTRGTQTRICSNTYETIERHRMQGNENVYLH